EITYKGFELSFFFQFVKQLGYSYGDFSNNGDYFPGQFSYGNSNQPVNALKRWQNPGNVTDFGMFTTNYNWYQESDHTWTDASFIRLKNLSVSYRLPEKLLKSAPLKNCKFYIQGQNLWKITK